MRKFLSLLLAVVLTAACSALSIQPNVNVSHPAVLDLVRPLQASMKNEDGETMFGNICTVESINQHLHYWATAAHCVVEIDGVETTADLSIKRAIVLHLLSQQQPQKVHFGERYIEQHPATLVAWDLYNDMAIIQVNGLIAPSFKMQPDPPTWNEEIQVAGHPFGFQPLFLTRGWIANPSAVLTTEDHPFILFNLPVAPGNSGSPVINLKGEMLSILQVGFSHDFSPVSGGITYPLFVQFAQKYFSK